MEEDDHLPLEGDVLLWDSKDLLSRAEATHLLQGDHILEQEHLLPEAEDPRREAESEHNTKTI